MLRCRLCGAEPAAPAEFNQNIGMGLVREARKINGPFCRSCGLHVGRSMTDKTLYRGWWGIFSFAFNLGFIASNLSAMRRLKRLPEPVGGQPELRLDPGRPLHLRIGLLVVVAVLALVSLLMVWAASTSKPRTPPSLVGRCVSYKGLGLEVVPCTQPHAGKIVATPMNSDGCPLLTDEVFSSEADPQGQNGVICVDEDQ